MESRQHYIIQGRRFLDEAIRRLAEHEAPVARSRTVELPPRRPHALDHTGAHVAYRVEIDLLPRQVGRVLGVDRFAAPGAEVGQTQWSAGRSASAAGGYASASPSPNPDGRDGWES